jgi:hypothetical protein
MRHSNTGATYFICQGKLEKKGRTIGPGIAGTRYRIPGNRVMEADTTQIPNGRIKLLK